METNTYILADPVTKDACIIDPGGGHSSINEAIRKNSLNLKFIINTHGHGDHIAANGNFDCPIYIHRLDKDFLSDPEKNLSRAFFFTIISPPAQRLLEDGDRIDLGELELKILHTPGHTPGSVSINVDGVIFTGDALFRGSIGRTDFAYGDEELLIKSIRKKLLVFDNDTVIYPGHGRPTTLGEEKRMNPFL